MTRELARRATLSNENVEASWRSLTSPAEIQRLHHQGVLELPHHNNLLQSVGALGRTHNDMVRVRGLFHGRYDFGHPKAALRATAPQARRAKAWNARHHVTHAPHNGTIHKSLRSYFDRVIEPPRRLTRVESSPAYRATSPLDRSVRSSSITRLGKPKLEVTWCNKLDNTGQRPHVLEGKLTPRDELVQKRPATVAGWETQHCTVQSKFNELQPTSKRHFFASPAQLEEEAGQSNWWMVEGRFADGIPANRLLPHAS
mmetsp:Transcript_48285/g.105088  ORF Transcript_48285/g.105088 Transcript_48285/m.105088 type:complete len:257 (-) Transcript_48285:142-912(-)|eukprot:CAMPEP_0204333508 /NCGR_PEP_ID=MMETSP0469-20131031/17277_1 /ASSEMBLY_ACC=CAM_ASM_000384 /TAXON_ID=2969 /ORGANISM="Oxyrrhis marina" /LENGTH=256 /DNA_ID=CAMNT_0051316859 /DNA_START=51 /DNA_END=821 /DNA_ORIENTATION=-